MNTVEENHIRVKNTTTYKTVFGGILHADAIIKAIKKFYSIHNLDLYKKVMFTSDVTSVMLRRINGVAALLIIRKL